MPTLMVIGEALYDLFAQTGKSLVETPYFTPRMGGAPANLAVNTARLGINVGFVGRIGADAFGRQIKAYMAGQGVDITYLAEDEHHATMLGLVALPTEETPEFLLIPGASAALDKHDIPAALVEQAKVLAFGAVNLAWGGAQATLYGAQIAHEAGRIVVFDVNLRPTSWPSLDVARAQIFKAVDKADVVKLNLDEGRFLLGHTTPDAIAQALLAKKVRLVCLSLGRGGSQFFTKEAKVRHPGFSVKSIDATGAGDAFLAGVCVSLCEHPGKPETLTEADLRKMAAFANGCGALAATRLGAMEASFNRNDVLQLMAEGQLTDFS